MESRPIHASKVAVISNPGSTQAGPPTMLQMGTRAVALAIAATLLARSAQAVVLNVQSATGFSGETLAVSVDLDAEGASVAGTQNDIGYDATQIAIVAKSNGKPDCAVNDDINKAATSFAFQPPGCNHLTACAGVRALVLALDNVDPIADGSTLYTCQVRIADDASFGTYTLTNSNVGASDPDGNALTSTGTDGSVEVPFPDFDSDIVIGNASGVAGSTVAVDVSLITGGEPAGSQNSVAFSSPLSIPAKPDGTPDCVANEAIDKGGTSFAFRPSGCTGDGCTGVRALVLALDNVNPIPTDSVLYTCQVVIAAGAALGDYTLGCDSAAVSDPAGGAHDAGCSQGMITVKDSGRTTTPTETPHVGPTGSPASTDTFTRAPATRTIGPTPQNGNDDDDGCAILAPEGGDSASVLLLPIAALLWLRRSRLPR